MIEQSTAKAMNPFIDEQQDIDSQMQPRNMFSVKFGGSQSQNTMNEMDNHSQDPNSQEPNYYLNYQMDPNCRRDLPDNPMVPGAHFTIGAQGPQEY
jgi:hypothetical protein